MTRIIDRRGFLETALATVGGFVLGGCPGPALPGIDSFIGQLAEQTGATQEEEPGVIDITGNNGNDQPNSPDLNNGQDLW